MSKRKDDLKCLYGVSSDLFKCAELIYDGIFDIAVFPKGMSIYHGSTPLASNLIAIPVGREYYNNIDKSEPDIIYKTIIAQDNEQDIAEALSQFGEPVAAWFADPERVSDYPCQLPRGESAAKKNCCPDRTIFPKIKGVKARNCLFAYKFKRDTTIVRLDTPRNIRTIKDFLEKGGGSREDMINFLDFYGIPRSLLTSGDPKDQELYQRLYKDLGTDFVINRVSARIYDLEIPKFMCRLINYHNTVGGKDYAGYGAPPMHSKTHLQYGVFPVFHQEIVLCNPVKTLVRDYENPIDWQYQAPQLGMNIILEGYIKELKTLQHLNYKKYSGTFYENAVWCTIFSQWFADTVGWGIPIISICLIFFYNYREVFKCRNYNYILGADKRIPFNVDTPMVDRTILLPDTFIYEFFEPLLRWETFHIRIFYVYWNVRDILDEILAKFINDTLTIQETLDTMFTKVFYELGRQRIRYPQIPIKETWEFVIFALISDLWTRAGFPEYANPLNDESGSFHGNLASTCFVEIKNVSKLLYPGGESYTWDQLQKVMPIFAGGERDIDWVKVENFTNETTTFWVDHLTDTFIYGKLWGILARQDPYKDELNFEELYRIAQEKFGAVTLETGEQQNMITPPQYKVKKELRNDVEWWWSSYIAKDYIELMKRIQARLLIELPFSSPQMPSLKPSKEILVKGALYMFRPIMKIIFEEYSNYQYPNRKAVPPRLNHGSLNHLRSVYFCAFTLINTNIIEKYNLTLDEITALFLASSCKSIGRTNEVGDVTKDIDVSAVLMEVGGALQDIKTIPTDSFIPRLEWDAETILPIIDGEISPIFPLQPMTLISMFIQLQLMLNGYKYSDPPDLYHYLLMLTLVTPKQALGYDFNTSGPYRKKFIDLSGLVAVGHFLDHCRPTTGYSQLDSVTRADPSEPENIRGRADPWVEEFLVRNSPGKKWLETKGLFFKEQKNILYKSGYIPTLVEDETIDKSHQTRCARAFVKQHTSTRTGRPLSAFTQDFIDLSQNFDLAWDTIIIEEL